MKLCDLNVGEKAKIISVDGEENLRGHLLDMGLIPGTIVEMAKVAPMGSPIQITLRGYDLSLRKEDCPNIIVEEVKE